MQQLSEDHRNQIRAVFGAGPLMPVIAVEHPEQVLPLCRALVDGGIRALEITLRTEHGLAAIALLREAMPEIWVGAGTVVTPAQYRAVESAGAQFVVTPGITEPLLEFGLTSSVPLLPGIATVSELMLGYNLGYREFKFFPAAVAGGPAALQAIAGPFPDVSFCPTGGIRLETAGDYLVLDNVLGVGGTWLTPREAIAAGDWPAIAAIARDSLTALREWA